MEAVCENVVDAVVNGDKGCVDDELQVLLQLVELVPVGAIPVRDATVVHQREYTRNSSVDRCNDCLARGGHMPISI